MARFYGNIGFSVPSEIRPGVWEDSIVERPYYGDVIRNSKRDDSSDRIVADINITNEFSILADEFANENFHHMKYIEFMGAKWLVSTATIQRPRIILTVGGVYNGPQT